MRTLVILFTLYISINLTILGQTIDSTYVAIGQIQELPIFPGGPDKIWCFIENQFKYDILNTDQRSVEYLIRFYIDSSGKAREFTFIKTKPSHIFNDKIDSLRRSEILRTLALMPNWDLPRKFDKKFKYWCVIPIKTPYIDFKCKKK